MLWMHENDSTWILYSKRESGWQSWKVGSAKPVPRKGTFGFHAFELMHAKMFSAKQISVVQISVVQISVVQFLSCRFRSCRFRSCRFRRADPCPKISAGSHV
jgi:hypothetical protein